jgi:hypothetical protein
VSKAKAKTKSQEKPATFLIKSWIYLAIFSGIFAVIFLAVVLNNRRPKTAAEYIKSWPLIPLNEIPKAPMGPKPMTAQVICQNFVAENPETWVICVAQLMETMPDKRLSQMIQKDFLDKRLSWSITPNGQPGPSPLELAATFALVPAGMIRPGAVGELPVITFNGNNLTQLKSNPLMSYDFWLVLGHEYQHWLQWNKATDPEVKDLARRQRPDQKLSPKQCLVTWQNEVDAYMQECLLANNWGVSDTILDGDLCRRITSEPAFKQKLFLLSATAWESVSSECFPIWAKDAGY